MCGYIYQWFFAQNVGREREKKMESRDARTGPSDLAAVAPLTAGPPSSSLSLRATRSQAAAAPVSHDL